jgi:FixJ family two-component response regulator
LRDAQLNLKIAVFGAQNATCGTCLAIPRPGNTTLVEKEIRTVVIVEDDSSVLRSLEKLIRAGGFDVRVFDSPKALLQSDFPRSSTCMIIDLYLPEMDGIELCSVLAARGLTVPAILMTARTEDAATDHLLRKAEAVAILYKPFDAESLFAALSLAFSPTGAYRA